jgi:hypothetical protein
MLSRRQTFELLTIGAVGIVGSSPARADTGLLNSSGCRLVKNELEHIEDTVFAALDETLIDTTGNAELDRSLGRALVRLSTTFGQRPAFGFADDSGRGNAYASRQTRVKGTWGTVLYGRTLFRDLLERYDDGGVSILAVAAHEFAHIAQFRSNLDHDLLAGQPNVKRTELHADFMAGYFLGLRKRAEPSLSVWAAGNTLYRIGDYDFNNRDHHGTPDERVRCAERGYALGYDEKDFAYAFSRAAEYVRSNY